MVQFLHHAGEDAIGSGNERVDNDEGEAPEKHGRHAMGDFGDGQQEDATKTADHKADFEASECFAQNKVGDN